MNAEYLTSPGKVTIMAQRALGMIVAGLALLLLGVGGAQAGSPRMVPLCHFQSPSAIFRFRTARGRRSPSAWAPPPPTSPTMMMPSRAA
jgi:hypothetical protein